MAIHASMKHPGQQDSISAFLAIHQVLLEGSADAFGEFVVEVMLGNRVLVDEAMVHPA